MRNYIGKTIAAAAALVVGGTAYVSAAQEKISVAIGQKGLWDTMVTVQGIEEGFFSDEGLDVEVTWTRGGSETLQAAITGSTQFAMANGLLGVLSAYEKGAPVRIVSAEMTSASDLFWYVRADSDIQSIADAGGRTMGFSRPGSSTNLVALALGKNAGVEPEYTPTGGISGTRTQVLSGQIDIGWSVPPFNLDLVQSGELRIIAKGSDLADMNDRTTRVNVVNADFLAANPEVVESFMRAYARTIDWMYEEQEAAVARYAEFNGVELSVAKEAVTFYPRAALAIAPIAGFEATVEEAIEFKRLEDPLTEAETKELVTIIYDPAMN